jgi:hypothetical protein
MMSLRAEQVVNGNGNHVEPDRYAVVYAQANHSASTNVTTYLSAIECRAFARQLYRIARWIERRDQDIATARQRQEGA